MSLLMTFRADVSFYPSQFMVEDMLEAIAAILEIDPSLIEYDEEMEDDE